MRRRGRSTALRYVPVNTFWLIIAVFLACLWPALFLLTWRDARFRRHLPLMPNEPLPEQEVPAGVGQPVRWYWLKVTICVVLYVVLGVVIWPGIVGSWIGGRQGT